MTDVKPSEAIGVSRHVRALSDPVSRGGGFASDGSGSHLLDHEPNPFEQSFGPRSGPGQTPGSKAAATPATNAVAGPSSAGTRRARSSSPSSFIPRSGFTPGAVQRLPPLGETPGGLPTFTGWGVDSLRSGPLSPALLNGPAVSSNPFDSLRTGLTPLAGGVSFPPPSPATAALFAMMTNNTPGTSDASLVGGMTGGGSRPHEGANEGNHFEASFAQAAKGGVKGDPSHEAGSSSTSQASSLPSFGSGPPHVQGPPAPLGALHRSTLASQMNGGGRSIAPQDSYAGNMANRGEYFQPHYPSQHSMQAQQQLQQQQQHLPAHQQQQHYGNQNPLYLLSQASSHNDDAVVAAAALSNLSGPSPGFSHMENMNGSGGSGHGDHRMEDGTQGSIGGGSGRPRGSSAAGSSHKGAGSPVSTNGAPTKGKRGAAAANKRKKAEEEKRQASAAKSVGVEVGGGGGGTPPAKKSRKVKIEPEADELDPDDDEEDSMSPLPHNPNETEEEKRKNFLERNRQAALKCRQRKKAWLANLQSKVEYLTQDNDTLQSTVANLKDEVASLRAILAAHASCPIAATNADRRGTGGPNQASQHYGGAGQQRF